MTQSTPAKSCDFCCKAVPANAAYRVLAMDYGSPREEAVDYAFDLCRPCYMDVGRAICNLMQQVLQQQTAQLAARAQTAGLRI